MRVILQKDVPNLGDAGEIKTVADGYARNFLIPRKLVIVAHEGSRKALEHQQRIMAMRMEQREKEMSEVAQKMQGIGTVEMPVRVGVNGKLFGSVTPMMVATALQEKGFPVEKRKVELGETIKSLGEFKAKIRLSEKQQVTVTLQVVPDEESRQEEEEAAAEAAAFKAREEAAQAAVEARTSAAEGEQAEAPAEEAEAVESDSAGEEQAEA